MKRFIDLTHRISEEIPVFPGHPFVKIRDEKTILLDGRSVQSVQFSNHAGTHVDAPSHFIGNGDTVEKLSLEALMGQAFRLDLRQKGKGSVIDVRDLQKYDGFIRKGARLLLQTGWDRRFLMGDYLEEYPCLTFEAAGYLVEKEIGLIGMDTPSPGPVGEKGAVIHRRLLGKGIVIVESLKGLERIEEDRCQLIVLPLLLTGCSGSPCRAIAVVED